MSFLFWFENLTSKKEIKKSPNLISMKKIKKDQFLHFIGEYFSLTCIKKSPKKHFIK